jgi:hypothetical protein
MSNDRCDRGHSLRWYMAEYEIGDCFTPLMVMQNGLTLFHDKLKVRGFVESRSQ